MGHREKSNRNWTGRSQEGSWDRTSPAVLLGCGSSCRRGKSVPGVSHPPAWTQCLFHRRTFKSGIDCTSQSEAHVWKVTDSHTDATEVVLSNGHDVPITLRSKQLFQPKEQCGRRLWSSVAPLKPPKEERTEKPEEYGRGMVQERDDNCTPLIYYLYYYY